MSCNSPIGVIDPEDTGAYSQAAHVSAPEPLGELRTYPGVDHFDVYDGEQHEALLADQIDFLSRHLLMDRGPGPQVAASLARRAPISPTIAASAMSAPP